MGLLFNSVFWIVLALVAFRIYLKLITGWCRSQVCLIGKTTIVTGANTGIGYETAIDFAKRGARVILACRDEAKGLKAQHQIRQETNNPNVYFRHLDFQKLSSVREFVNNFTRTEERLDILVNNAGAVRLRGRTEDGFYASIQVNYLGPFLLTLLLLDLMKKTPSSRIVNVSSTAPKHSKPLDLSLLDAGPDNMKVYYRAKFANILFTIELASRLAGTSVTTYSLHPGVVTTEIFRDLPVRWKFIVNYIMWGFMKTSLEGAQTTLYCALQQGIEQHSGEHFEDCHLVSRYGPVDISFKNGTHKQLWRQTIEMLKLNPKLI